MNKILRYSLMSALMLMYSSMFAQKIITLNATDYEGGEQSTVTKDVVTLTVDEGTSTSGPGNLNNGGQFRIYKGNILTVSSSNGTITKIVFTCTANGTTKYGPGCFKAQEGYTYEKTGKTGTWVGSASSVEFTAESNQVRATTIEITISDGTGVTKESAGLTFSETTIDHEVGTTFTAPTFTKATTAAVTFNSDNENVAAVNSEGVITIGSEEGKAVITATSEENDEYMAGNATCTVYVWHYNVYKKATTVENGKQYLIVAQRDNKTYYAMPAAESSKYDYLKTQNVEGFVDEIKIKSSYNDEFVFNEFEGGFSIRDCYGRYLWFDDAHASFQMDENQKAWTVEANADGTFKLTNNNKYIQWGDKTYTTFGGYAEKQENTVLPMLYALDKEGNGIKDITTNNSVNKNNNVYNLAGQRVNNSYKGIVIKNGKKFFNNK